MAHLFMSHRLEKTSTAPAARRASWHASAFATSVGSFGEPSLRLLKSLYPEKKWTIIWRCMVRQHGGEHRIVAPALEWDALAVNTAKRGDALHGGKHRYIPE